MTMKQVQHDKMTLGEQTAICAVRAHLIAKLRGQNLDTALEVFRGGIENANDTVFLENSQPRTEWLNMFILSMMTLLSQRHIAARYPRVLEVFARIDVRP